MKILSIEMASSVAHNSDGRRTKVWRQRETGDRHRAESAVGNARLEEAGMREWRRGGQRRKGNRRVRGGKREPRKKAKQARRHRVPEMPSELRCAPRKYVPRAQVSLCRSAELHDTWQAREGERDGESTEGRKLPNPLSAQPIVQTYSLSRETGLQNRFVRTVMPVRRCRRDE